MTSEDQGAKLNAESAKLRAAVQSETDKRWEPFFDEMRGLLGGLMLALMVILFWSFVFENPLSMLWPW